MRTPRWTQGAYTVSPRLTSATEASRVLDIPIASTGAHHAIAAIESWAGSRQELLAVVQDLLAQVSSDRKPDLIARVTLVDGRSMETGSFEDLRGAIESTAADQVTLVRVELRDGEISGAAMVATPNEPGLRIHVWSDHAGQALGIAQVAFQRMMLGYVDRMGGWRALIWMATAIAPLLLVSIGFSSSDSGAWARGAVLSTGFVGSVSVFMFSYGRILVPGRFWMLEREPTRRDAVAYRLAVRFGRNIWTRRLLAAAGALTIGVLGNKLSELIPWP